MAELCVGGPHASHHPCLPLLARLEGVPEVWVGRLHVQLSLSSLHLLSMPNRLEGSQCSLAALLTAVPTHMGVGHAGGHQAPEMGRPTRACMQDCDILLGCR